MQKIIQYKRSILFSSFLAGDSIMLYKYKYDANYRNNSRIVNNYETIFNNISYSYNYYMQKPMIGYIRFEDRLLTIEFMPNKSEMTGKLLCHNPLYSTHFTNDAKITKITNLNSNNDEDEFVTINSKKKYIVNGIINNKITFFLVKELAIFYEPFMTRHNIIEVDNYFKFYNTRGLYLHSIPSFERMNLLKNDLACISRFHTYETEILLAKWGGLGLLQYVIQTKQTEKNVILTLENNRI